MADIRDVKKSTPTKTPLENISELVALLRDYSNSCNLYSVAELSSDRTGGNCVQVETETKKNYCPQVQGRCFSH